ncbi:TPA: hypothetical protein ACF027_002382 [Klebsiella quasipneumoniae subsp. similipneumoniae]
MSKRDLITEIKKKNSRSTGKYLHGKMEIYDLKKFSDSTENHTALSLIIMGLASCIEVSVKEAIKKLIDYGDPFLSNADGLIHKFDFSLTKALSLGHITFGDLVSHSVSVSNLEHIASHFEKLISTTEKKVKFEEIITNVKVFVEPDVFEAEGFDIARSNEEIEYIIKNPSKVLSDISKIFEIRHIVAHEASFDVVDKKQLECFIISAQCFLDALYELIEQTINPGASRDSFNSSIQGQLKTAQLFKACQEIQELINEKIGFVRDDGDKLRLLFERSNTCFEQYFESEKELRLGLHGMLTGNSMRNIESAIGNQIYSERIGCLKDLLETVEFQSEK